MDVAEQPLLKPSGKWVIGGAILLAVAIAAVGLIQANQESTQQKQEQTAPTSDPRLIAALGRIEPAGEVIEVSGPTGERILRLMVKEGQQIEKGRPIALLESYPERQAEAQLAANQFLEAQNRLAKEQQLGLAQGQEAETKKSQVINPKQKQILAQRALVSELEAERLQAENEFKRYAGLEKAGAIATQELENKALALRSKEQQLENAIATLAMLDQELLTSANQAEAEIVTTIATSNRSQAQIEVASARSNLELAKARLARTIIRAPQAGQILKVLIKEGEAIAAGGSQTNSTSQHAIVELGDTRQMYVVAEVYETDINQIRVGQPATITSPVLTSKLQGTVEKIGLKIGKNDVVGTDPAANTDTRVIEVKIRLQNSLVVAGFTNLQVDVSIEPKE